MEIQGTEEHIEQHQGDAFSKYQDYRKHYRANDSVSSNN